MRLAKNGRALSRKYTRHINIQYLFVTDQIKSKEMRVKYCPSELLIANFHTKSLQGALFQQFQNFILNINDPNCDELNYLKKGMIKKQELMRSVDDIKSTSQECVEQNAKKVQIVSEDSNDKKRLAKSRSYVEACMYNNYENNETRALVVRYKPVLLTKLRKSSPSKQLFSLHS